MIKKEYIIRQKEYIILLNTDNHTYKSEHHGACDVGCQDDDKTADNR